MTKSKREGRAPYQTQQSNQPATLPAAAVAEPAGKKKYNTITLNVSKGRAATKTAINDLAARLGCRLTDLLWLAIENVIANPPETPPKSIGARAGHAAGFWVIHTMGDKGLEDISIVEVDNRSQSTGAVFFRYDKEDTKSRTRSLKQAQRAAAYAAGLAGMKAPADGFPVERA
jgi:hypothetical protein